ncbi:MAG TPA: ABC transporter permease [Acidimicrobiales bacterium]
MTWRDAVRLAARTVRRRPGRAVLTVLAVTLAAALLTALLTISTTAETRVLDQLSSGGPLAGIKVAAAAPDPGQVDQDNAAPGEAKVLDEAALAKIAALPEVRDVVPIVSTRVYVVTAARDRNNNRVDPFLEELVGVDLTKVGQLPITPVAGRLPSPGATSEIAVTQGYLERLGLQRVDAPQVVGTVVQMATPQVIDDGGQRRVRGRWVNVTIVGVAAQEAGDGQFLGSTEMVDQAREWARAGVDGSRDLNLSASPYTGLFVVARGIDNVSKVRAQITAIGYSTSAPENLIASVRRYLHVVEIVLSAVGIIALVVAALGISNAMLAAVRERRREIGVLKAIGARDRDVYRVFLLEAGTLGLIGGVLGTMVGWAIAGVVGQVVNGYLAAQRLVGVKLTLPLPVVVGGIVGSTVLALLAGTLPAVRAARLPAREAVGGG